MWGCFFYFKARVVLRVNNKEHAVGATESALKERISLNGILIFSSVRDQPDEQRKEETLILVFIVLRPLPAPQTCRSYHGARLCGDEGAVSV